MKMKTNYVSTVTLCSLFVIVTFSHGITIGGSIAESKACSKYDFEEKLLEKLVRIEHAMELTQDRMKNLETKIDANMKNINETIKHFELEEVIKQEKFQFMLDKMTKQLADNKIALDDIMENFTTNSEVIIRNVVKRYERMSKVVLVGCNYQSKDFIAGSTLKFPTIVTKIGLPLLTTFSSTGKFICPARGIYYISAAFTASFDYVQIEIMKNSSSMHRQIITGYTNNQAYWSTGSVSISLELDTNDTVWIKNGRKIRMYMSCLTIFKL